MRSKTILLVDPSQLRQPFFSEILRASGRVLPYSDAGKALRAIERGLAFDIAVLHYRLSYVPLVRTVRRLQPKAGVIAYGAPRSDMPLEVDRYLTEPILSAELEGIVEYYLRRGRRDGLGHWAAERRAGLPRQPRVT